MKEILLESAFGDFLGQVPNASAPAVTAAPAAPAASAAPATSTTRVVSGRPEAASLASSSKEHSIDLYLLLK